MMYSYITLYIVLSNQQILVFSIYNQSNIQHLKNSFSWIDIYLDETGVYIVATWKILLPPSSLYQLFLYLCYISVKYSICSLFFQKFFLLAD